MTFTLPAYDQIPNVGMYLEQVTRYLNDYLEPLGCAPLTGSMIANYVKKGLVKNPVKKQYDREHIARLLEIAVSKTVLSLEEVQQLLLTHPMGQEGYEGFCAAFLTLLEAVFTRQAVPQAEESLLWDTLVAVAYKLYLDARFKEAQA